MWLERMEKLRNNKTYNLLNLNLDSHFAKCIVYLLEDIINFEDSIYKTIGKDIREEIDELSLMYYIQITIVNEIQNEILEKKRIQSELYNKLYDSNNSKRSISIEIIKQLINEYFPNKSIDEQPIKEDSKNAWFSHIYRLFERI